MRNILERLFTFYKQRNTRLTLSLFIFLSKIYASVGRISSAQLLGNQDFLLLLKKIPPSKCRLRGIIGTPNYLLYRFCVFYVLDATIMICQIEVFNFYFRLPVIFGKYCFLFKFSKLRFCNFYPFYDFLKFKNRHKWCFTVNISNARRK